MPLTTCDFCDEPDGPITSHSDGSTLCAACNLENPIDETGLADEREFYGFNDGRRSWS